MRLRVIFLLVFPLFALQDKSLDVQGYDCGDCHGASGWDVLTLTRFDHRFTDFPLEGVHQIQRCSACHPGTTVQEKHQFQLGNTDCISCHLDVHKSTLGDDCTQCHDTSTWQVTQQTFDHEMTQFSLLGAHRLVPCQDCHLEKPMTRFEAVPTDCYACHRKDYDRVSFPSHLLAKIDTDCELCHSIQRSTWVPSQFNHDEDTPYLLTGAHKSAECAGCHQGIFLGTPQDCWSCHEEDFTLTGTSSFPNAPPHAQDPKYSQSCEICHQTDTWLGAEMNHDLTPFPLSGLHKTTSCEACHAGGVYDLPLTCDGCHLPGTIAQTTYELSSYDHPIHQLPNRCELCHTTQGWSQLIFDHENFSTTACEQCHLVEHTQSADPVHSGGNIGTNCRLCHETRSWVVNPFPHTEEQTGYGLVGIHLTVSCDACHLEGEYNNLPNTCQSSPCHLEDYQQTTDPDHQVYGYPVELCSECHSPIGWQPHQFTHNVAVACGTCHTPDYNSATDPVHSQDNGFGENCELCHHSTDDWSDATFDHTNVSSPCVDCHLSDYENTTDPNHPTVGYPTTCDICHLSTTNWGDATFTHNFPIYTGEHAGKWSTCTAECHIDLTDYSNFSCGLNGVCHEHDQDKMNDEHDGVNGYVYESSACYSCHPTGGEDKVEENLLHKKEKDWKKIFKKRNLRMPQ